MKDLGWKSAVILELYMGMWFKCLGFWPSFPAYWKKQ